MSVLSETTIQISKETIQLFAISNSALNPSIAICTKSRVLLYNDQGEKHDYELARNQTPTAIEWHPNAPTLAIGWQNGTLTLWQEDARQAKEESSVHKEAINLISFNPAGSRMVTADHHGLVVVWRGITPMSQYQKDGLITICIFADLNNIIKSQNLFFFGGKAGLVCLADDSRHCSEVCKVQGSVKSLMIYEKQNSVIIITSGQLLVQFKISTTEKTQPDKKVKLSIAGDIETLCSTWIGACLVAMASNENMIRMWHLEADENYALTLHSIQELVKEKEVNILSDKITNVAYNKKSKYLIAGTREGRLVYWKNNALADESPIDTEQWKATQVSQVGKTAIQGIVIGKNNGLVAARSDDCVKLIQEIVVNGKITDTVKVLQVDAQKILIYPKKEQSQMREESENRKDKLLQYESKQNIKAIDCNSQFMLIQSTNKIEIVELLGESVTSKGNIEKKCLKAALYGEDLLLVYESTIEVANQKGVVKQTIQFSESDGNISSFYILGKFMVVWTTNNYFKIFDLSRREVKQNGVNRKFENAEGQLGIIRQCSINCDGTKVGIIADNHGKSQDRFFIYDLDLDNFQFYELSLYRNAVDIQWDQNDSRFFAVQTVFMKPQPKESEAIDDDEPPDFRNKKIMTFFYNVQTGIREQDIYTLEPIQEKLFAVRIPYIHVINRIQRENDYTYRLYEILMNEFNGLEKAEESTKRAVVNFSYHLSSGNLDEAYKSVKAIQNPSVWEKMAQMSVKSRRLDVAEICIGNMRFARGAKAIRETKKEPEYEAQLAMVAIQLNMFTEAEKLYLSCKRYDLLNKLYQAKGDWSKAIEVAERHDRINLKATYFKMARQYEVSKDFEKAIEFYEKSGNAIKEVPRMLNDADQDKTLEEYINKKKDPQLFKWLGNHYESQEKFDQALKYYRDANETLGIVRVLLYKNDIRGAKQACDEKGDPAAYYYLAKQLEQRKLIPEAIQYYARAQYYSQAVRLAQNANMISDVNSISLLAPKQVMIQSAKFFEQRNIIDKAVLLYMKGGQLNKALELAQKSNLTEYVKKIKQEISIQKQNQEENILAAQMPVQQPGTGHQGPIQKQASLKPQAAAPPGSIQDLLNRKDFLKVLDLCEQQGTPITDDLVKKMVDETPELKRKELQTQIAERCKKIGNFDQASKIYIQMGERVKAMKALCKLGDTDRIIAFANSARMAEIYVLAGNHLQTGEWHKTPELMKHIIQFYNKAKAFDHLAVFFDACSTVEIDEYRDYEKAAAALREAIKHSEKSTNQTKTQQLKQKLQYIDRFVQARSMEPTQMLGILNELLQNANIDYAVRQGDIHAEIVELYYSQKQFERAFDEIQKMQKKSIVLNPYLDQDLIQNVMNYMRQKGGSKGPVQQGNQPGKAAFQQQQEDDFQEEDVIDDNI